MLAQSSCLRCRCKFLPLVMSKIRQCQTHSSGNGKMKKLIHDLKFSIDESQKDKNYQQTMSQYQELKKLMSEDNFWEKNPKAAQISQQFNTAQSQINSFEEIIGKYNDTVELYQLAESEKDESLLIDCESTLTKLASDLQKRKLDLIVLLMDEGHTNCFVEIVAGTGGMDAFDWTKMLATMYSKWGQMMGYQVQYVDENIEDYSCGGDGYRRVTLRIDGDKAYGHMTAEAGVHRLVRISPYDPKERRHTSFSQVRVYPVLESDTISTFGEYNTDPKYLRIDTFRSRGNGGQSVNTTDSAVRITHLPTGIVVGCQNERSQIINKAVALKMLKSKLCQLEKEKKQETKRDLTLGLGDNTWGSQIRSVILQPYTLAKDHRSGWETSNVEGLLAGNEILTDAIESYLLFVHSKSSTSSSSSSSSQSQSPSSSSSSFVTS